MAWMKIDLELPDKPEVHAIAGMLNIDPDMVVGKLIRVWQWFDKHTTDGNAFGVTYALPDRISGVPGFGEAMAFVGWLEQQDKNLVMPKFDRHTSESAKARALTSDRVAKHKAKSNADGNDKGNGDGVSDSLSRLDKKRINNKKKNASQLPDDFTLNETSLAYAKERGVNITSEIDGFRNYHEAKGSTYKDWQAAWRTWCDNSVKFGRTSAPKPDDIPKLDTSIEARRSAMQAQADESFKERQWLDGERRYRTLVTIEGGQIKRTKHYLDEQEAAA